MGIWGNLACLKPKIIMNVRVNERFQSGLTPFSLIIDLIQVFARGKCG